MNVLDKSAINNCTSCQLCAAVCAKKAISVNLNKDGFYRPVINDELCNDCGICTTICYRFDNHILMTSPDQLEEKPLFSSWSTEDDVVRNTTSGGIGDLLAHRLLQDGYKVVGVVYNEEKIRAEHSIAMNKDDLLLFRGSKYIQSYTFDAFKEVVANCRKEKYAVFGTPCQIYALNRLATIRKVRNNFFFVDLYCHGCPSLYVWTKYQSSIKQRKGMNHFNYVNFRSKARGWGMFKVEARSKGGATFVSSPWNDCFYELFFSDLVLNDACNDCRLRSTLEYTDIRLGDFWGKKFLDNYRGVSAVSISTELGMMIFQQLERIEKKCCDYKDFLPYQSWGRDYCPDEKSREKVLQSLSNSQNEIKDAIRTLRSGQNLVNSIKWMLRFILAFSPIELVNSIKKFIYTVRRK